jgi:hypothetical protein
LPLLHQPGDDLESPDRIELNSSQMFWPDIRMPLSLASCPRRGCRAPQLVGFGGDPGNFAVDDGHVYFLAGSTLVIGCEVSDCAHTASRFDVKAPPGETAFSLGEQVVVHEDYLYLHDARRIIRIRKDGTAPFEVVARDVGLDISLAFNSSEVIWMERGQGRLRACPKAGCAEAPRVLVSGLETPFDLAVDDQNVYFTEPENPSTDAPDWPHLLSRCAVTGCDAPTVLVSHEGVQGEIAIDDHFVYFAGSKCSEPTPSDMPDTEPCGYLAAIPK